MSSSRTNKISSTNRVIGIYEWSNKGIFYIIIISEPPTIFLLLLLL